jgi:hypothetical protein
MKSEILKKLSDNNAMSSKGHPVWIEAFEAYTQATGDREVSLKCGSCYRKVLSWLNK